MNYALHPNISHHIAFPSCTCIPAYAAVGPGVDGIRQYQVVEYVDPWHPLQGEGCPFPLPPPSSLSPLIMGAGVIAERQGGMQSRVEIVDRSLDLIPGITTT